MGNYIKLEMGVRHSKVGQNRLANLMVGDNPLGIFSIPDSISVIGATPIPEGTLFTALVSY